MTSGQGGSGEPPTGRPGDGPGQDAGQQGWQAPPPPPQGYPTAPPSTPGYPAAPPSGPGYPTAPPGYPAAPSYGPSGWQDPSAPKPVERPVTVRAGIGAFMANLILGVIATIVTFTMLDDLIDRALADTGATSADVTQDTIRAAIILGAIIGLVLVGLEAMFLWFAWNGRNWARIVLWVIGGFGIVSGLFAVFGGTSTSGFLDTLAVIQFLLVLAGVILLALAPSNEWYRYRSWLRATGQGR